MMRSLFSGVSGMQNHQTRMDVIGNNIANVNTTGFKRGRVNFQDLISQQLSGASRPNEEVGGVNPKEVGLGVMVASIDTVHTQGALQSTGINTDINITAVLLDFFKFRDFVFEYKKDGFAGILLNINLDQAMVLAEAMHTQLKELLESENIREKLAIGISTRSLRLLPGSRLITEANQALEKAFGETGLPIVAFRVNPDKYRQFVADATQRV